MESKVFILKSNEELHKDVPWNVIPHLKDEHMNPIRVSPTQESINKRWLEWIIPDTPYNRTFINANYGAYEVIEVDEKQAVNLAKPDVADEELTLEKQKNADLEAKLAEATKVEPLQFEKDEHGVLKLDTDGNPIIVKAEEEDEIVEFDADGNPVADEAEGPVRLAPTEVVKLKAKIKEKLTALGVKDLPEKATLKEWEELLKEHVPENK